MTTRYCGDIIRDARSDTGTGNDIPTSTSRAGIKDRDYVRYMNYAQQKLQSAIVTKWQNVFNAVATFVVTPNQKAVILSSDPGIHILMGTQIKRVRYGATGASLSRLRKFTAESESSSVGTPFWYYRSDDHLILSPIPQSSGVVEIIYTRALPRLALRYGQIQTQTLAGPDTVSLTLIPASLDLVNYPTLEEKKCCVSDETGTVLASNISFSTINTVTGLVTLSAPVALPSLVGGYITIGAWTATHSELSAEIEPYLIEAVSARLLNRQSSADRDRIKAETQELMESILSLYAPADSDPTNALYDDVLLVETWNET